MAGKKTKELTPKELEGRKKIVTGIMYVISALIILYAAYFIYLLTQNEWNPNNNFLAVMMGCLTAVIASLTAIRASIDQEIRKRTEK